MFNVGRYLVVSVIATLAREIVRDSYRTYRLNKYNKKKSSINRSASPLVGMQVADLKGGR